MKECHIITSHFKATQTNRQTIKAGKGKGGVECSAAGKDGTAPTGRAEHIHSIIYFKQQTNIITV